MPDEPKPYTVAVNAIVKLMGGPNDPSDLDTLCKAMRLLVDYGKAQDAKVKRP